MFYYSDVIDRLDNIERNEKQKKQKYFFAHAIFASLLTL